MGPKRPAGAGPAASADNKRARHTGCWERQNFILPPIIDYITGKSALKYPWVSGLLRLCIT
jgi:hypothetical protein